jgi:hypothetical protein
LFDLTRSLIGLRTSEANLKHAYPVSKVARNIYQVSATAFTKKFHIDVSSSQPFQPELIDGVVLFGPVRRDCDEGDVNKQKSIVANRSHSLQEFKDRTRSHLNDSLELRLLKQGNISFNRAVYEALNSPQAVLWFFDSKKNAVGLKPSNPSVKCARPVIKRNDSNYKVSGKAFVRKFGIDTSKLKMFQPILAEDVVVFRLDEQQDSKRISETATYVFQQFNHNYVNRKVNHQ